MSLAAEAIDRPKRVITIIDDDEDLRAEVGLRVEDNGFAARPLTGAYGTDLDKLLHDAMSTNYVICDHQLSHHGGYAQFDGSTVASALIKSHVPTIMVSDFLKDESLKLEKFGVMHRFSRNEIDQGDLRKIFEDCSADVFAAEDPCARFYRTIVRSTGSEDAASFVATVPRLGESEFRVNKALLPPTLLKTISGRARLFARVNLNAAPEDLTFRDFELAPDPDPDDGLA